MKKIILIAISLVFTTQIHSQEMKKDYIGGHIGMTNSKIKGGSGFLITNDWKSNITFGFSYQHYFSNFFGIETQLNYLNIGTGYKDVSGDAINDSSNKIGFKTNLEYINVPVIAILSPFKTDYFYLSGGFYISNLISAKHEGNLGAYPFLTFSSDKQLKDGLNKWDYGSVVGIGSKINFNENVSLGIDLKYNYSFIDINKSVPNDDNNYTNKYISINFSLRYKLKNQK